MGSCLYGISPRATLSDLSILEPNAFGIICVMNASGFSLMEQGNCFSQPALETRCVGKSRNYRFKPGWLLEVVSYSLRKWNIKSRAPHSGFYFERFSQACWSISALSVGNIDHIKFINAFFLVRCHAHHNSVWIPWYTCITFGLESWELGSLVAAWFIVRYLFNKI